MNESTRSPLPLATLDDVADIESVGVELGGRIIFAWCRLKDRRGAIWEYDLRAEPPQDQSLVVIEGA